jgi:glycosyltransferase involved in cell wall biosynthesis
MEEYLPPECPVSFGDMADCLELVRARKYDIVHANSGDWNYGIPTVRLVGAQLVITAHGMVVEGWNSTNCDGFTTVSQWQADKQSNFTDLPIHVIYNGLDIQKFKPPTSLDVDGSAPIVAWVGRGIDMVHKRIDRLAAIAPALRQAGARIWIADPYGPDEVEKVVPDAARVLREQAEFWDGIDREKLPDFYRAVARSGGCILSTSVREGFGLVLAEAQACGCPAIGPDVVGVNEVVRPVNGGVIYPPDITPGDLVKLIMTTLNDREGMRVRRQQAVEFAKAEFDLEKMVSAYENVYKQVLTTRQPTFRQQLRNWLAPITSWNTYVAHRWSAGRAQYDLSRELQQRGEDRLASAVMKTSFATCPTQFAKPDRLVNLFRTIITAPFSGSPGSRDNESVL